MAAVSGSATQWCQCNSESDSVFSFCCSLKSMDDNFVLYFVLVPN